MPQQSESEHTKQERWRADVRAFICDLLKHWHWWLSATIGSGLAAYCAAWMAGLSGGGRMIPFWVFETAAATGLVVASFRAFCGQRRIAEAHQQALEEAIAKYAEEESGLKSKVRTLQMQLDDHTKRMENEETLGNLHQCLLDRARVIREIGVYEYPRKYAQSYKMDAFDPDTQVLLDSAEAFLGSNIKGASIAIFRDTTNIKLTSIEAKNTYSREALYWHRVSQRDRHLPRRQRMPGES